MAIDQRKERALKVVSLWNLSWVQVQPNRVWACLASWCWSKQRRVSLHALKRQAGTRPARPTGLTVLFAPVRVCMCVWRIVDQICWCVKRGLTQFWFGHMLSLQRLGVGDEGGTFVLMHGPFPWLPSLYCYRVNIWSIIRFFFSSDLKH